MQAVKDFTQQASTYGKEIAEKSEAAAEAAGKSVEQSYASAASDAADFNAQWIEMLRANANASLDFAHQLISAKSPSEFFELSASHTQKQLETFAKQAQQLAGFAQKATADAVKPLQAGMKTAFDKAA